MKYLYLHVLLHVLPDFLAAEAGRFDAEAGLPDPGLADPGLPDPGLALASQEC